MNRPSATILSGSGRYADPWHPFAETSAAVAEVLRDAGFHVDVEPDVDGYLARGRWPDLLVTNVGLPRDEAPVPRSDAGAGLRAYLQEGRPLLATHVSSTSFTDEPAWETALGGRWVRGTSMHPEQSRARIRVLDDPLTDGIDDFEVFDERYSYLRVSPDTRVLASHRHDGVEHPLVWLREAAAPYGRAAYDALGHDARSFESAEHRALLGRMIAWLRESI